MCGRCKTPVANLIIEGHSLMMDLEGCTCNTVDLMMVLRGGVGTQFGRSSYLIDNGWNDSEPMANSWP